MFKATRARSLITSRSDHLPILLTVESSQPIARLKRFKFENLWLREDQCREVVISSWYSSRGFDILGRLGKCSDAVWRWGKLFTRNFLQRIEYWEKRMEIMKKRTDPQGWGGGRGKGIFGCMESCTKKKQQHQASSGKR
nr:uncharacterized protein LOC109179108 [Ipomoea batatas]